MLDGWLLIGAGHCGFQLARAMAAAGIRVAAVVEPNATRRRTLRRHLPGVPVVAQLASVPEPANWLVSIPDDALPLWPSHALHEATSLPRIALHTSGLHPSIVLAPLARHGVAVGSFHPLVSFPSVGGRIAELDEAWAAIEGDARAMRAARRLSRGLGMRCFVIDPALKARYHAAASIAANLTHILIVVARSLLVSAGVPEKIASNAITNLALGAVRHALQAHGLERLTGPLARRDPAALRAHMAALPPEIAAAYAGVVRVALDALIVDGAIPAEISRSLSEALTVPPHCVSVQAMKDLGSH